jgi:hypothetical protein
MSCLANLSIGSKGPYLLIRPLDRAQTFTEAVFLRVAMELLLGDYDVWSVELEYRLKRAILLIRPFDRAETFTEAVFLRLAMEWLLGDEDVWSIELDHLVQKAIPFDPTGGSRSNFYRCYFPDGSCGMANQ